jgi:hypothetical protein
MIYGSRCMQTHSGRMVEQLRVVIRDARAAITGVGLA